jgi:hypothetical protein
MAAEPDSAASRPRASDPRRDSGRAALMGVARLLMTIRAHRDAAPDGLTEITDLGSAAPGFAARMLFMVAAFGHRHDRRAKQNP